MRMFKHALEDLFIRAPRTLLFVLPILLLLTSLLVSASVFYEAETKTTMLRKKLPYQVTMQVNVKREKETIERKPAKKPEEETNKQNVELHGPSKAKVVALTLEKSETIAYLSTVEAVNYISELSVVGEKFSPHTRPGLSESEAAKSVIVPFGEAVPQFQTKGVLDTSLLTTFATGTSKLIEGRSIQPSDEETAVAMIERRVAVKNGLGIGDSITVSDTARIESKSFKIIGIYQTTEVAKGSLAQKITYLLPQNTIYVPVKALGHFYQEQDSRHVLDRAIYQLKSATDYDQFRIDALQNGIDLDDYQFYPDDSAFLQQSQPYQQIMTVSRVVSIIGIVLGMLVMFMMARHLSKRVETYSAQLLMEMGMLLLIAAVVTTFFAPSALNQTTKWIQTQIPTHVTLEQPKLIKEDQYFYRFQAVVSERTQLIEDFQPKIGVNEWLGVLAVSSVFLLSASGLILLKGLQPQRVALKMKEGRK